MKLNLSSFFSKSILMLASFAFCAYATAADMANDGEYSISNSEYNAVNTSTPWSMLSGESLNEVARLFYPNNHYMQRRFVAESVRLSRHIQPNLNPANHVEQDTIIIIPNIKFLDSRSGKRGLTHVKPANTKGYNNKNVTAFEISPALQLAYDNLLMRNNFLKEELEKLNAKLAELLRLFASLRIELMRMLEHAATQTVPESTQSQASETSSNTAIFAPDQAGVGSARGAKISWYLLQPILTVLFVMSLFLALAFFKSQQTKYLNPINVYLKAKGGYGNIKRQLFNNRSFVKTRRAPTIYASDFPIEPVAKSEYSGTMIVTDLSDLGISYFEDDASQALEQAKIFLEIQREDEAIKLLKAQISAAPKATLQHWILLLDIFRNTNQKEEFMQYAKLLHENFNVIMPAWESTTLPAAITNSLEEFEHISAKMTQLWANCEKEAQRISQTKKYLDDLLLDNRNNERTGFSIDVFKEIMLLRNMLDVREKLELVD
ncbi:MAG: hypothetical protein WBC07_04775 [Methylotenera sp.]